MNNYPERKNYHPNNPTTKWSKELLEDELKGQKTISIKIETHRAIQELSSQRSGATYDDIILMCINSYHKEKESKGYDPLENIVSVSDSNEEE
jgi:hypothetical protein